MKTNVYVCSNLETLADGYISENWNYAEELREAVSTACRAIDDCDSFESTILNSNNESTFRDWHGGKFDQFSKFKGRFIRTLEPVSEEIAAFLNAVDDELIEAIAAIGEQETKDISEREAELAAEENAE
jgi:hypothetical protein